MANQQTLAGNWNEMKGYLQERWGQLTDDDLREFNGDVDQLVGLIQQKTGESREAVQPQLEEILSRGQQGFGRAAGMAGEYAKRAADTVSRSYNQAAGGLRSGYAGTETLVRHHPGPSVAAAFGVGLIVGLMVGLSSGSRS